MVAIIFVRFWKWFR